MDDCILEVEDDSSAEALIGVEMETEVEMQGVRDESCSKTAGRNCLSNLFFPG